MLAAAALFLPVAAPATQIIVDVNQGGDHETIQDGIDAASEGDTVLVYPGTYTGEGNRDIEFGTKNIVLRGRDGAEATIVDASPGVHRVFVFTGTGQDTTCVIDGLTITGGHQQDLYTGSGAGIYMDGTYPPYLPPSPKFANCIVSGNQAFLGSGGGAYMNMGCSAVFRNVVFEDNLAYVGGGGVYCTFSSNAIFSDCVFRDNQNTTFGFGGGLGCKFESNATLRNCLFDGNLGTSGGGVSCTDGAHPTIDNCTFIGNTVGGGGDGGGLYCAGESMPTLRNCTFYGNRALGDGEGECIAAIENSHPIVLRCIFVRSGYAPGSRLSSFYCEGGATLDVGQSCSYGNAYGDDMCGTVVCGSGFLICENPLFCDPAQGDLRLAEASPCLPGNTWGVRIGAHGQGCSQPAVEQTSWGAIKALYR